MTYTRKNIGTCSVSTTVELENGIINEINVKKGCDGNLKGVCALLKGRAANEAAQTLLGIKCDARGTSCPEQIAYCLMEAIEQTE